MKLADFFVEKIKRLTFLAILFSLFLVVLNFFTNNLVIVGLGAIQEKTTVMNNSCDEKIEIKNGVLELKNFVFKTGFGSCVNELNDGQVKRIILNNVFGGDVTETRILSRYVKKNKIPVYVKGRCDSSCLDVVLHSPQRMICYTGNIGIHAYRVADESSDLLSFLAPIKQNAMLRAFDGTNINVEYIKTIMKKTSPDNIFYPSHKDLVKNKIIHREIPCNSDIALIR